MVFMSKEVYDSVVGKSVGCAKTKSKALVYC